MTTVEHRENRGSASIEWIRRHRRNIGVPVVLVSYLLAQFHRENLIWSIGFVSVGEWMRIWAAGHLQKEQLLSTGGPYRFLRHPLYLGSFLMAIGFCLVAGSLWVWILALSYFLLCYLPVILHEEKKLREMFPDRYASYAASVPALFPTLRAYPHSTTRFSWKQVIKNKEYNALLGILLAYLLLHFR